MGHAVLYPNRIVGCYEYEKRVKILPWERAVRCEVTSLPNFCIQPGAGQESKHVVLV